MRLKARMSQKRRLTSASRPWSRSGRAASYQRPGMHPPPPQLQEQDPARVHAGQLDDPLGGLVEEIEHAGGAVEDRHGGLEAAQEFFQLNSTRGGYLEGGQGRSHAGG